MANNKSIQILRGTNANIVNSDETLLPGQPLYNLTKGYLTIGGGANGDESTPLTSKPIVVRELVAYLNDKEDSIGADSNEAASIRVNTFNPDYPSTTSLMLNSGGSISINASGQGITLNGASTIILNAGLWTQVVGGNFNVTAPFNLSNFGCNINVNAGILHINSNTKVAIGTGSLGSVEITARGTSGVAIASAHNDYGGVSLRSNTSINMTYNSELNITGTTADSKISIGSNYNGGRVFITAANHGISIASACTSLYGNFTLGIPGYGDSMWINATTYNGVSYNYTFPNSSGTLSVATFSLVNGNELHITA